MPALQARVKSLVALQQLWPLEVPGRGHSRLNQSGFGCMPMSALLQKRQNCCIVTNSRDGPESDILPAGEYPFRRHLECSHPSLQLAGAPLGGRFAIEGIGPTPIDPSLCCRPPMKFPAIWAMQLKFKAVQRLEHYGFRCETGFDGCSRRTADQYIRHTTLCPNRAENVNLFRRNPQNSLTCCALNTDVICVTGCCRSGKHKEHFKQGLGCKRARITER